MKRVCYIHQYFKTPAEGGALRSYFIAQALISHGATVEMLTSHNKPNYELHVVEGINVHYLPVKYSNNLPFQQRLYSFIKFAWLAIKKIRKIARPDIVYASSTPLSVGIITIWLKWIQKIPYIFEVRDLWPEAPIQLKIINSKFLIFILKKFEKTIYKNATEIIALSPGMKQGILNCFPESNVSMIPNMSDIDFFSGNHMKNRDERQFSIGYFGALGIANNVNFIIEIAKSCQAANQQITFIIAGDGSQRKDLLEYTTQHKNITLLSSQNRSQIKELMNKVDACLTSFLDFPVLSTNSPNKFFDSLAAGKLCIVNTKGWLKKLVEEEQCGLYVDATNPNHFPSLIQPFVDDKDLLLKYQENAASLAKKEFSKLELTEMICEVVFRYK